jgi:hypothetical protein
MFATADECADALVRGEPLARVTPVEVAHQLGGWAEAATSELARADALARDKNDPRHRRVAIDGAIAAGVGRFFACKLRASVLFGIFDRTGDARPRAAALAQYRSARAAWAELALGPAQAYAADVTFGFDSHLRGHWQDRLAAIDRDIAEVEARPAALAAAGAADPARVERALAGVLSWVPAPALAVEHESPGDLLPGEAIQLAVRVAPAADSVRLFYRRLNQAEAWIELETKREGEAWRAAVPADYARSAYPIQYYFAVRVGERVTLWPGFGADFSGQPYLVLRRRA